MSKTVPNTKPIYHEFRQQDTVGRTKADDATSLISKNCKEKRLGAPDD